jgi:translation initiation factor IF-3
LSSDGVHHIALDKQHQRLNGEINAPQIRLVGVEGEQLGIVPLAEALAKAEAAELDLVEIAPMADPPVCRIMDYGKFKYRESKKQHEAKLKLKQIKVKEVKFRPGTDEGDYKIKLRNLTQFLTEGDKAKITLRFRGREMAHQEFGVRLLERIKADLEPYSVVESFPRLEGRQMVMLLAPKKVQVQKAQPQKHHSNKPEAGQPSNDDAKASPAARAKPRAKESTTVGSK